jgi:hypothetical protein
MTQPGMDGKTGASSDANIPDDVVAKVGAAVAKVALMQQAYANSDNNDLSQPAVAEELQRAAVQAISEEGLSVDDYNDVLSQAETNPDLEERLLAAARVSL